MAKSILPYTPPIVADQEAYPEAKKPLTALEISKNRSLIANPSKPSIGLSDKTLSILKTSAYTPQVGKTIDPLDKLSNTANIVNGVQAAGSIVAGIMSLKSVNALKPELVPQAPTIEAVKVSDSGAQQLAAGQANIDKAMATTRESARRSGNIYSDGIVLSKEMEAQNNLAGQIEGMRTNIEVQNVNMQNQVNQQNAASKARASEMNAQILNNFQLTKAQMKSGILSNITTNVNQNTSGIINNMYGSTMRQEEERVNDEQYLKSMEEKISIYNNRDINMFNASKSIYDKQKLEYEKKYGKPFTSVY